MSPNPFPSDALTVGGKPTYPRRALLTRSALALLFIGLIALAWQSQALAQTIRSQEETARVVVLEKLSLADGSVSGEIHNLSPRRLRDVQLFIRRTWFWNNEFKPGKDDPGTSVYYTVQGDVPPQGKTGFKYAPSKALPQRSDGYFETTVSIAGFTELIPPPE
jgi:hypothetical protein